MNKKDYKTKISSGKIAKFLPQIQAKILLRDKTCIICRKNNVIRPIEEYHHVYYGAHQAELNNPERNTFTKGVGLCHECHNDIHHGVGGEGQSIRDNCISYINKIYGSKERI